MVLTPTHDPGTLTADISTLTHTKTPTALLLSVPREIRDKIYAYLLRAGDLAILRTSKQLGHEAGERLYREGVCRIKIGVPNGGAGDSRFPQEWKKFQNYHFHVFFGPGSTLPFHHTFWQFGRFAELKETDFKRECLITIEYGIHGPRVPIRHEMHRMKHLFAQRAYLTTFTTVVVTLVPKPLEIWKSMVHKAQSDWCDEKTILNSWRILKGKLEPDLGPAKLVGDADGEDRRLVFHPREFRTLLGRRQQDSES